MKMGFYMWSIRFYGNLIIKTIKEGEDCTDGFNDISMIEYAGLGVAMENAQPIVKETADFITKSNDEDGILHVINTFLL